MIRGDNYKNITIEIQCHTDNQIDYFSYPDAAHIAFLSLWAQRVGARECMSPK